MSISFSRALGRGLLAATLGVGLAASVQADVGDVEIIAPAGPGGGYDQLARALQATLEEADLASNVQVINVPGAGGTIGLAQFVNNRGRGEKLMVAGLGMVGAIKVNASPVTLDQTTPLARLTGDLEKLAAAPETVAAAFDGHARAHRRGVRAGSGDDAEPRDVVAEVLDRFPQDVEAEDFRGTARGHR